MTSRNRRRQRRLKWMGCDDNCHRLNGVLLCFNQTPPASMPAEARLESVSVPAEKSKSLYLLCISFCTTVLAQKKDAKKTVHLGKNFEPLLGDLLRKKKKLSQKNAKKKLVSNLGIRRCQSLSMQLCWKKYSKKTPLLESISRPVLPMQSVMLKPSP